MELSPRVLITGVNGFTGLQLVEVLTKKGFRVYPPGANLSDKVEL